MCTRRLGDMTDAHDKDPHRPLEPGQEWRIGGQDRQMSEEEQLEQLVSYIDAHYETPDFRPPWDGGGSPEADHYCALLPCLLYTSDAADE